jgi:hypothetical protein
MRPSFETRNNAHLIRMTVSAVPAPLIVKQVKPRFALMSLRRCHSQFSATTG